MMNQELPEDLLHHNGNSSTIIRVSFVGTSTGEPVISSMIQNYSIHANILYANIDRVKDTPFGILTLELMGGRRMLLMKEYISCMNRVWKSRC